MIDCAPTFCAPFSAATPEHPHACIHTFEAKSVIGATVVSNNQRVVLGERPWSCFNVIAALSPLLAALATRCVYRSSFDSIKMPNILAVVGTRLPRPLTIIGRVLVQSGFRVKRTHTVFSPSNVTHLRFSHPMARSMFLWSAVRFTSADGPTTRAAQLSTKAMLPPLLSIRCCTRSAWKERSRIGDRGDPCGGPACANPVFSEWGPFMTVVVVQSEQDESIYRTNAHGIPRTTSLCGNLSLHTPLYVSSTSKLMKLTTLPFCHAPKVCSCGNKSACSADRFLRAPKWFVESRPKVSATYEILSATTASTALPSVDSGEMRRQAFATR